MSKFEINKIAGAVLFAVLVTATVRIIGNTLVAPHGTEHATVEVAAKPDTAPAKESKAPTGPMLEPVAPLLAAADTAAGRKVARKCTACHTLEEGGANRLGPNLWGVVGRDKAGVPGFAYSSAMKEAEGAWDYAALNAFLANPRAYLRGTKMVFAGLKKTKDRADIIAFLRSLSATPAPLP